MSGWIIITILGKRWGFPGVGPSHPFMLVDPGTVMASLGMSFSLMMCYNELILGASSVQVDLSAILDPFGSNQFLLCLQAMSSFQEFSSVPFPSISKGLELQLQHQSFQ